jgi:hypothetical protein
MLDNYGNFASIRPQLHKPILIQQLEQEHDLNRSIHQYPCLHWMVLLMTNYIKPVQDNLKRLYGMKKEPTYGCNPIQCNKFVESLFMHSNIAQNMKIHSGERCHPRFDSENDLGDSSRLQPYERIHSGEKSSERKGDSNASSTSFFVSEHKRKHT